jgi:F-type H+-transporting ATPase subunit epsilon
MERELTVRVITPERIVADTTARSVRIPGLDGSIGILPRHARMIAALDAGLIFLRKAGGAEEVLFVTGGFADVRDDTVRVLTSAGEHPADIDVERARAAERRARERIDQALRLGARDSAVDFARADAALRRSMMRIRVHGRHSR